jgi:hypothetical protein
MKLFPRLAFTALVLLSISCSIDQDDITPSSIHGTWEYTSTLEESDLDLVNAFVFNGDGTFETLSFFRATNSSRVVGFSSVISGTFELKGNTLTLTETYQASVPAEKDQWYVSENELVASEWNNSREIKLTLKKNRSELEMDFGPCAPNALCIGSITFFRVGR